MKNNNVDENAKYYFYFELAPLTRDATNMLQTLKRTKKYEVVSFCQTNTLLMLSKMVICFYSSLL